MAQLHFADASGRYIGSFDGSPPPDGSIERPAPANAAMIWANGGWTDAPMDVPAFRASARCSRMQGILALGETRWAKITAYRDTATWAERIVIDDASDWHRNSENIAFFGYLLGMDDADIDAAFQSAIVITP